MLEPYALRLYTAFVRKAAQLYSRIRELSIVYLHSMFPDDVVCCSSLIYVAAFEQLEMQDQLAIPVCNFHRMRSHVQQL